LYLLGALLVAPFAQAVTITVNLGQSAQNETLTGIGPNSTGLGQYYLTFGTCTASGGSTTCVLTGSFTSSAAGLTSGTYTLVTTYVGTGTSPLQGTQTTPGAITWYFSTVPATSTMTLTLVASSGTTVVPILAGGQFPSGAGIGFAFGAQVTCGGTPVSPCSVASVGVVAGATIMGPPTALATFDSGSEQTSDKYYFSDFAFSGGYQTTLTYVNYSPQTVTCTTNFYGDNGAPVAMPFSDQTGSTRSDTMAPGGSIHVVTAAPLAPPYVQGWAQATCTGPVQAGLLYRYFVNGAPVGEASVNAESSATTEFATFAQTATGIAYANPSGTVSATITVEVYTTTGGLLGSKVITLGPLQHGAANVGPLLGLTNFTGFVKISSPNPFISLSLNAEAFPVFSSLPPGDLPPGTTIVP
jgi:hypothetical protein